MNRYFDLESVLKSFTNKDIIFRTSKKKTIKNTITF